MPIHGIEAKLGIKRSRIDIAAFCFGITGTCAAFALIYFCAVIDWKVNIGGKPSFALPDFIPIMFELTVLFSAVGMVMTFCYLCQLAPFVKKDHFNLRSTDDTFLMALEVTPKSNEADVINFLQGLGASDVQVQYKETGWWLGRYDKDTKRFEKKEELPVH